MKSLFATLLTDTKSTDVEGVGKLRFEDEKVYRWVKNAEASTASVVGGIAGHKFSDGAAMKQLCYIPSTANLGAMAGVWMAIVAAGSYGWIQVLGYTASALVFGSQTTVKTAGDTLLAVNAATYADADTTMGTAPKYRNGLTLLVAVATVTPGAAAAAACLVNCFHG